MKLVFFALILAFAGSETLAARDKVLRLGELYWLLDRACWQGDELSVEILLRTGADPSGPKGYADFKERVDRIGVEPTWHLVQAAYGGSAGVVRRLLKAGADPNLICGPGETALTVAASKGHVEIVRILLAAGAKKDFKGFEGTASEIATRLGKTEIVDLLRDQK